MGNFNKGISTDYSLKKQGNGIYIFVLEGEIIAGETALGKRDGMGLWNTDSIAIQANTEAQILVMEVPMNRA